jgi:hypothetical protein
MALREARSASLLISPVSAEGRNVDRRRFAAYRKRAINVLGLCSLSGALFL